MTRTIRSEKRPMKKLEKMELSKFKPIKRRTVRPLSGVSARNARKQPKE